MSELIPLCYLRIWCRMNDAWLSFKLKSKDRFLINPAGYYIELPDGSLAPISPRITFPFHGRFPSVPVDSIVPRSQYGDNALFVSVPMVVPHETEPVRVDTNLLLQTPLNYDELVGASETEIFVLLRAIETGIVSKSGVAKMMELRQRYKSIGKALVDGGICTWETILGACLDTRPPSRLDPPTLRTIIERKEWELTGEILSCLGIINRTQLEYAVKIKREGGQALGQILTAMGACKQEDVEQALKIQKELQGNPGAEVALIGKLLVSQGLITDEDLEDALRNQRIARQPLSRILVSMGACSQRDIDGYANSAGSSFQSEIDEIALGNYLTKTETITKTNLEEAQRIQARGRQVLGELLVSMGMCSNGDLENILRLQRDVRESYRSGVEKLGAILIHQTKVPQAKVEEAAKLQGIAKQPFGAILVATGACGADDIMRAIDLQSAWRSRDKPAGDRLGEVLVKQGIITEAQLEGPLLQHIREEKPLGRLLIEKGLCTPEQIIDTLISRDLKRQQAFVSNIKRSAASSSASNSSEKERGEERAAERKGALANMFNSLFKPKDKP